ncbi:MAG: hypothetical protein ACR2KK_05185 [Acidimicrobiales bacterium]
MPATGVSAVVLNVTVTEPATGSFLTIWPAGQVRPLASSLSYSAGQTVPNLVTVKVGEDGRRRPVQRPAAGSGRPLQQQRLDPCRRRRRRLVRQGPARRIFDTRAESGRVGPGGTLDVQVTGRGEVPVSGVSAVVLNVTVTEPTAGSFLPPGPQASSGHWPRI